MKRSEVDLEVIISVGVYVGMREVGVEDRWIVMLGGCEVWLMMRRGRREGRCRREWEREG